MEGARRASRKTVAFARTLRRRLSLPEVLLWQELRRRPAGYKFRRQHPVGPYVADFYCTQSALAIEVDGSGHDMGDRPHRDSERDAFFATRGIRTLRIAARDVLSDVASAVTTILHEGAPRQE